MVLDYVPKATHVRNNAYFKDFKFKNLNNHDVANNFNNNLIYKAVLASLTCQTVQHGFWERVKPRRGQNRYNGTRKKVQWKTRFLISGLHPRNWISRLHAVNQDVGTEQKLLQSLNTTQFAPRLGRQNRKLCDGLSPEIRIQQQNSIDNCWLSTRQKTYWKRDSNAEFCQPPPFIHDLVQAYRVWPVPMPWRQKLYSGYVWTAWWYVLGRRKETATLQWRLSQYWVWFVGSLYQVRLRLKEGIL